MDTHMAVGAPSEVVAESAERGVVLLKDDSLSLSFADLLGDDPETQRISKTRRPNTI